MTASTQTFGDDDWKQNYFNALRHTTSDTRCTWLGRLAISLVN